MTRVPIEATAAGMSQRPRYQVPRAEQGHRPPRRDLDPSHGTRAPATGYECRAPSPSVLSTGLCSGFAFSSSGFVMIECDFNSRTLVNMNIALERVCRNTPLGEQHDVRKRVAQGILQCARSGKTTLGALAEAGVRALARIPERTSKSA